MTEEVLGLHGLHVGYHDSERRLRWAVEDVSLSVSARERIGIVGESGSGKSSLALASLGLARGATVQGRVTVAGQQYEPTLRGMRAVRGSVIGLVLQDPLSALNPTVSLGRQLEEVLTVRGTSRQVARARAVELLDRVGVARAAERLGAYPHEFSGGMRQRVVIAMALMASPQLLVADEPTTALDVRAQRKVLDLIVELCRERDMALVLISHDIDVVADVADRTMVLYAGRPVEIGPTAEVLGHCAHPYTEGLMGSRPELTGPLPDRMASIPGSPPSPGSITGCCRFSARCAYAQTECRSSEPLLRPVPTLAGPEPEDGAAHASACHFTAEFVAGRLVPTGAASGGAEVGLGAPRARATAPANAPGAPGPLTAGPSMGRAVAEIEGLTKRYGGSGQRGVEVLALSDVSLTLRQGQVLGVVGESGSGKSTLARCVAGLTAPSAGRLEVAGMSWEGRLSHHAHRELAKRVQLVFQDPYTSLNPRMKVGELVGEGLRVHKLARSRQGRQQQVAEMLDRVGLDPHLSGRHPRELSGGQRQRVAIARALAVSPEVLVLDEPVSALDLSVQAQVLNLVRDLARDGGQSVLFISHDLAVIRFVCDDVVVVQDGAIVERGEVEAVLAHPQHPFTQELIAAVPGRSRPNDVSLRAPTGTAATEMSLQ